MPKGEDALKKYRQMRSQDRTSEPFSPARSRSGRAAFVVQKHQARRLHYDFRLEWNGVLLSWAVPEGPTLDASVKRLAVQVEPHPLDYANFEGVIPKGNYGAGSVIVWDRGIWEPLVEAEAGLEAGNLKFRLFGHKLRGDWVLVRTKGSGKEWLLIKKKDGFESDAPLAETSVLSGLELEDLKNSAGKEARISAELKENGTPADEPRAADVELMLAQQEETVVERPGWIYELKYDGYRVLAQRNESGMKLRYRRGFDATSLYPEVTLALKSLPFTSILLDGEVVVFDDDGKTNFSRLQHRAMLAKTSDVSQAEREHPACFMAFDVLGFAGHDLRALPLSKRKEILMDILPKRGVIRYVDHVDANGEAFYRSAVSMGAEGIVAKKLDAHYVGGRSPSWAKTKPVRTGDFVVVGYSKGGANREGISSLHLALKKHDSAWVYAGRVGSGLAARDLAFLAKAFSEASKADYGFENVLPGDHVWVEPSLVCEVRYKEWEPGESLLRHPVFVGFREDKSPSDCILTTEDDIVVPEPAESLPAVVQTNREKIFWPGLGLTKGDLLDYYDAASEWLLPYLQDRPLVLTRYPDGIDGKSFYQKDAPSWVPGWIRRKEIWSEHSQRNVNYFIADDRDSLLYLANLGTIPLHVWASRASSLARPDWSIIDLDPKGAPFAHVVRVAQAVQKLCTSIELPCYLKTSGSTGLHVLIPLGGTCTYEQSRNLAGLLSQLVATECPDIATMTRSLDKREGKVYLDWLQNRHGQLLVSPFSVRAKPGATVSMPLSWEQLSVGLDFKTFAISNALDGLKADPMIGLLTEVPDLLSALSRLHEMLRED